MTTPDAPSRRETIKSIVEGDLRVTVYRRPGTANLQMEVERKDPTLARKEREKRRSLGHNDPKKAVTEAYEVFTTLRSRQQREGKPGAPLTLGQVIDRYEKSEAFKGTKNERVQDDRKTMLKNVRTFGAWETMTAVNLSQEDVLAYMRARTSGEHGERKVSRRRAQAELQALRTACNWAYATKVDGRRLVSERVFDGLTIPDAPPGAKPSITADDVRALWAAREKHTYPAYGLALALAVVYGKRSHSIRHLASSAVNLTSEARAYKGVIIPPKHVFWDPAYDKEDESGVFPMPEFIVELFEQWVVNPARKESAWIFYAPKNPDMPVSRVSFQQFGDQGFRNAGIPKPRQGGWHGFRRGFATRHQAETKAAMRLAGWKDVATFVSYQQPEPEDLLRVLNNNPLSTAVQ